MNLKFVDWIWRVRGTLPIEPGLSPRVVFDRIDVIFQEQNTTYRVHGDTLTFTKRKQLPQDKLSIYDSGTLKVSNGQLRYNMMSKALLACFLAPLFFYAAGQIGIAVDQWRNPPELAKAKQERIKKRSLVKPEDVPMHPIDKFLGAHGPEKKKADGDSIGKRDRKPSMKTAYTFMSIFFALWISGRILEEWLLRNRLRKRIGVEERTDDKRFAVAHADN